MTDDAASPSPLYSFGDVHRTGLLWFINRAALHPLGYALAVHYPDDADKAEILAGVVEPDGWSILGDGAECWSFTEEADDECFAAIKALLLDATIANHAADQARRDAKAAET